MTGIHKPNLTANDSIRHASQNAIKMLRDGAQADPAFLELHQDLLSATAKGRGNSEWLSFGDAKRIVTLAEDAGPAVADQMRGVLAEGLRTGKVDDNNLILGGRALKLLSEFTGTDPSLYLAVAGDKAQKAQVASMKARGLANSPSSFEAAPAGATAPVAKTSAWSGVLSTVAQGLRSLASRAKDAPAGKPALLNVDDANAYATTRLQTFGKDVGASEAELSRMTVSLSRSMFSPADFENQQQLHQAIDAATAFAARLTKDTDGSAPMNVVLTPKGKLERTAGTDADTLFVPVNDKQDELSLRKSFDAGDFIRPGNRFNPFAHMKAGKKRLLWQVAGNPAGEVRTKMRRVIGDSAGDLSQSIRSLLSEHSNGGLDEVSLKDQAKAIVNRFVSPHASAASGDVSAQDRAREKIDQGGVHDVVRMLTNWDTVANDEKAQEEVANFAAAKGGARIVDNRKTYGLVNVDTYDAISVAPSGVLDRHGAGAIGEVELNGTRVGLVNVSSTDVVTVVPDLARMLFGGVSLERSGI